MTSDQPISATLPLSPPALDRVIKTCLANDPDDRFQNVHDIDLQLKWIAEGGSRAGVPAPLSVRRKTRQHLAWSLAALASFLALLIAFFYFRNSPPEAHAMRFTIPPPDNANFLALSNYGGPKPSPDGRNVAFVATSGGVSQVWLRPLDSFKPHVLAGTEGAYRVFWSPDGRSLGFFAQDKLKRVPLSGGSAVPVCDLGAARGASWSRQDTIIFGKFPGEICQVSASGGQPKPVTRLDESRHDTSHRWPYFLRDGNHFLYKAGALGLASDENVIKVGSLDGKTDRILFHASSPVEHDSGYLLFVVNKNLMARPFNPAHFEFSADPITVVKMPSTNQCTATLRSRLRGPEHSFIWQGMRPTICNWKCSTPAASLRVSWVNRDACSIRAFHQTGKIVAFSLVDPNTGKADIWTQDLSSGNRTRITRDPRAAGGPTWTRNSSTLFYPITSRAE